MRDYSTAFSFILDGIMQKKKGNSNSESIQVEYKEMDGRKGWGLWENKQQRSKKKNSSERKWGSFFLSAHLICFALVQNKWGAEREAK